MTKNDSANQPDTQPAGFAPPSPNLPDHEVLERVIQEFTRRIRNKEFPAIAEYQNRHPHLADEIDELLASVAIIEQLKTETGSMSVETSGRMLDRVSELEKIGNYRIVREVGRGGMGVVFEAIHESLGRRVAIKVLPTPAVNSEKLVERFRREAQSAARLHHTNIVGVFGVGQEEGFHYYVMDFVDGHSLSRIVRNLHQETHATGLTNNDLEQTRLDGIGVAAPSSQTMLGDVTQSLSDLANNPAEDSISLDARSGRMVGKKLSSVDTHEAFDLRLETKIPKGLERFRWAAEIASNIADALSYAHEHKILHRDIKPSNLVLDQSGTVWITDFGLAKDFVDGLNLTKTGDVIGTPQYLAPESLEGKYDIRSETYCLGLTLYELLTLGPAYANGTTAELIRAVATESPQSPKKIDPSIPVDLSTIVDKAVSRDPAARYQTAAAMRNDLQAFLADRPISARRTSAFGQAVRWARRNPMVATLSALSVALMTLVAITATYAYATTTQALTEARQTQHSLVKQRDETNKALANLVKQTSETEQALDDMRVQFSRAESNVEVTLLAFDEMFKQVISKGVQKSGVLEIDGFRDIVGIESAITAEDLAFLEKLLAFYEQFAEQNADNEKLKIESAKAFRRVANIHQLVGDLGSSVDAYFRSVEIYESLLQFSPDSEEIVSQLAQAKQDLSIACRKNGQTIESDQQIREAQSLLRGHPDFETSSLLRLQMARAMNVHSTNLSLIASMENQEELLPHNKRPARDFDRPPPPSRHFLPEQNLSPEFQIDQAIQIADQLIKEDPDNDEYRSVRANSYCSLAALELTRTRINVPKALLTRDLAISELETLNKRDPSNPEYLYLLAITYSLSDELGDKEHLFSVNKSISIASDLADQYPNVLDYAMLETLSRIKLAGYRYSHFENDAALAELEKAKASIVQQIEQTPSDRLLEIGISSMLQSFEVLAYEYEFNGQMQKARQARNHADELIRLVSRQPASGIDR